MLVVGSRRRACKYPARKWSFWGEVMRRSHSPAGPAPLDISTLTCGHYRHCGMQLFCVGNRTRPVAEFTDANVKSEWLYTARTLAAVSIRVHFFFCWSLSIITLLLEKAG